MMQTIYRTGQKSHSFRCEMKHDFIGRYAWIAIQKQMNVVRHNLQCYNFASQRNRLLFYKFFQIILYISYKNFSAPFRTLHEVVVYKKYRSSSVSILLTHRHNYATLFSMRQAYKFQFMRSNRNKHLDATINVSAHIWNHSVALHRRYYKLFKKSLPKNDLQKHLSKLRNTRFQHWKLVDAQAMQSITDRLYRGFQAWFKHEIKRPPSFRSRKKYRSFTLKQSGWKLLSDSLIRIQGRNYRFHQSRPIAGVIKTLTISRDKTGRYFLSFSCDEVPQPQLYVKTGESAGVDFGLKTFLTLSTGEKIDSPEYLKHELRLMRVLSRNLSRKVKGSNSRKKARLELALSHRRISNLRTDFHWKTGIELVKRFDSLAFEDLNMRAMQQLWGRKISDLGFSDYLTKQAWLCEKYRRNFAKIPRFEPTTKKMSCCGNVQTVELSERTVSCLNCGTIHDRDVNAAVNILESGRRLWLGASSQTFSEAACVITAESHAL